MSNVKNNNDIEAENKDTMIGINCRNASDSCMEDIVSGFATRGIDRIVLCVRESNSNGNIKYANYIETDLENTDGSILLGTKDISSSNPSDTGSSGTSNVDLSNTRFAIKIHTNYLNEKAKTLANSETTSIRDVQKTHLTKLNGLISSLTDSNVNSFKEKIDWVTDFNESPELFEWGPYTGTIDDEVFTPDCESFVEQCLTYLRKKLGVKVGITFNKSALDLALKNYPGIINCCDVIGLNTYPPVGFINLQRAKTLTVDEMTDAISWTCLKDYIKSVLSQITTIKEQDGNSEGEKTLPSFIITEVGSGEHWSMLGSPADELNNFRLSVNKEILLTDNKHEHKVSEPTLKYMQAFYRYMKDFNLVDEINFWYITTGMASKFEDMHIEDMKGWLENGK